MTWQVPKGLNAPDPYLPTDKRPRGAQGERIPSPPPLDEEDNWSSTSLAAFSKAPKLQLKGFTEFALTAELVGALERGEVLPTGSFAPPAYAQLKRSVYVHKGERERLEADEVMQCSCTAARGGCGERCQNAAMQHECSNATCNMGEVCANRPFTSLPPAKELPLQLFKTKSKGWGVLATRDLNEGDLVTEYVGEVIDMEIWEARKRALGRFEHFYFMALNAEEIVDASRKGNIARFINHSCAPNLVVQKWFINRLPRLGLFATQDIPAGAEVVGLGFGLRGRVRVRVRVRT